MALSVASSIPEHYKRSFKDVFQLVIQQQKKKLADKVKVVSFDGKEEVYTDLEELTFVSRGRLQNSTPSEIQAHKRKMTKLEEKCQVIFDKADKKFLAGLSRPDSEVIEAMKAAWNRSVDSAIAVACNATVYGGVEPYTTAVDLPSTQTVAVNYVKPGGTPANSGLTPQKIIKAASILEENEIYLDEEPCCLAINPKGKLDLMEYVETSPNDVWASMIANWLDDENKPLFGFQTEMSNRLVNDVATDVDTLFAYSKERGIWLSEDPLDIQIDILPQKDHAVQISAYGDRAVMRRYEKTVVTIACDRTP